MRDRQSNVLSLLEDKTNDYARKIALGIKTSFGWKELTFDGLGLLSRRLASYLINDLGIQKVKNSQFYQSQSRNLGFVFLLQF